MIHLGDGYKLTYLGYDYLALQTLMKRGVIKDVIGKIGVGK
jgi:RIO kinase 2